MVDPQTPTRCPHCGGDARTTAEDLPWVRIRRYVCHACGASWDIAHFVLLEKV